MAFSGIYFFICSIFLFKVEKKQKVGMDDIFGCLFSFTSFSGFKNGKSLSHSRGFRIYQQATNLEEAQ